MQRRTCGPRQHRGSIGFALACILLTGLIFSGANAIAWDSPVFYPARYHQDTPNRDEATPIHLDPGGAATDLLLVLPPSGGKASVRVITENRGQPLAGILVEASVGRFSTYARTGLDGTAVVTGVPAGVVTVRTRPDDPRSEVYDRAVRYAPGVIDRSEAHSLELVNGGEVDFGTLAIPGAASVRAQVIRPDGVPWDGIAVVLRSVDGSIRIERLTESGGLVTFGGLEPGDYRLWADTRGTFAIPEAWDGSRDTLASTPLTVAHGESRTGIVITPDEGGRILGKIIDEDSEAGLPFVEVEVFLGGDRSKSYTFTTDELGFFTARGLPAGFYKVYAPVIRVYYIDAEDEEDARTIEVIEGEAFLIPSPIEGKVELGCDVPPSAAGVIEGVVRADFGLFPSGKIIAFGEEDTVETTVTEAGLYRIGCLEPGLYRVAFIPNGVYRTQYHPKTNDPNGATLVEVVRGDTADAVDFEPELGVLIEGRVVSDFDATPIEGVPVMAALESPPLVVNALTAADGFFRLDRLIDGSGMPAGDWIVGSDSLTISQVAPAPVNIVGLSAVRVAGGVAIELLIPERTYLLDWRLERKEIGGVSTQIDSAMSHPDRLLAREYFDRTAPVKETAYRLEIERSVDADTTIHRSAWVWVDQLPPRLYPQPWDGRGRIRLPGLVRDGEKVELIAVNGRKVAEGRARDDRVFFEEIDDIAVGVYFLRWRSLTGSENTARLVINR